MKILVTGGVGYIGSIMVKQLKAFNHEVVVADIKNQNNPCDLGNKEQLENLFSENTFEAVLHFAGVISMGESMENPGKYFNINTFNTLNLLETMVKHNVKKIIFSSTAGVYGNPVKLPIPEDHSKNPTNPYGESKLIIEKLLYWYDQIYQIRSVSLRYFNAAGSSLDGTLGENHDPETHIIPLAIKAITKDVPFKLYGSDYKTRDGTCVRDYIHVEDLCNAHLLALQALNNGCQTTQYNVGTGIGYSNKEVLEVVERVTGKKLNIEMVSRRPGDATELVADPTKIKQELKWEPKYSDLQTIVETAWKWYSKL